MKYIFLTAFFVLAMGQHLFSQTYHVVYEERTNIDEQLDKIDDPLLKKQIASKLNTSKIYELYHKDNIATYQVKQTKNKDADKDIALKNQENSNIKIIKLGKGTNTLYKDLSTLKYIKEIEILGKKFLIKDSLTIFNWETSPETKTIGGFVCRKAMAQHKGGAIIAWYTPSIPINDGPDKYWGLPGLIIELSDGDKSYHAISINKMNEVSIKKPTEGKIVTQSEYNKIKKERIEALKQNHGNYNLGQ